MWNNVPLRGIGRLVAFDLHRWWPLAAAVVALESGRALVVEIALHVGATELAAYEATRIAVTADALFWLLAIVTTAIVVQADHPDDDRAFWRTRPIPPVALGAAKAAVIGLLFAGVPAAVDALRLAAYGAPADAISASVLQIAARTGLVLLPAWSLALATRTLSRFLAAATIALAIGLGITMAASWHANWVRHTSPRPIVRDEGAPAIVRALADWQRQDRHGWSLSVVLTGAGVVVLLALYRTRRRGLAAAAGAVIFAGPTVWPIAATGDASDAMSRDPASAAVAAGIGGRMTIRGPIDVPARHWLERKEHESLTSGAIELPGLPANYSAAIQWRSLTLTASERPIPLSGAAQRPGASPIDVVPGSPPTVPGRVPLEPSLFAIAPQHALALLRPTLSFRGDADLDLTEHRLLGSIRLAAGQALRTERSLFEIVRVDPTPTGASVLVRLARFPAWDGGHFRRLSTFAIDRDGTQVQPVQAFWGGYTQPSGETAWEWAPPRHWVDLFSVQIDSFEPGQLSDGQLVLVASRPAGHLRTTLAAEDVPVRIVQ